MSKKNSNPVLVVPPAQPHLEIRPGVGLVHSNPAGITANEQHTLADLNRVLLEMDVILDKQIYFKQLVESLDKSAVDTFSNICEINFRKIAEAVGTPQYNFVEQFNEAMIQRATTVLFKSFDVAAYMLAYEVARAPQPPPSLATREWRPGFLERLYKGLAGQWKVEK